MKGRDLAALSDDALLERARAEPPDAESRRATGELLGRHADMIYAYCYRMVHDRERALDLAQDTMMDALRGLRQYQHRARFSSWLYAIARNRCLTALRPRSLARDPAAELDELLDPGGDPESLWLAREGEERLERLVRDHLDRDEQVALWLRCVEHVPVDEITRLLGIRSVSGARGLLQNARRKLRAALRREPPGAAEEDR